MQAARDRQKSYGDKRRRPLEFEVGGKVMLKVAPWKGVIRFGKRGKLNPRYIGPFRIIERIGPVAYHLELPQELSRVHNVFHVCNLKKCLSDDTLVNPLEEIQLDDKLNFVEEPVEIMDREVKQLKQSRIPIIKVRWNARRGPEYTWERKDQFKSSKTGNHTLYQEPLEKLLNKKNDKPCLSSPTSRLNMSGPQDEHPPPPPPPQETQQTPHTVSTIKLPILKKGEYDIWAMKTEHYLAYTDYPIWEVIQNGNGPVSVTLDTTGQIKILPPKTAEETMGIGLWGRRERKARTTLLMAIPEDHLAKFHKMTDAKDIVSNSDGIHKGYERFQSLLSQLEIHGAGVSTEDANQKFLRSLPFCLVTKVSQKKTGIESYSLMQMNLLVLISNQSRRLQYHQSGHFCKRVSNKEENRRRDGWNTGNREGAAELGNMRLKEYGKKEESKALVTVDGESVDWTTHSEDDDNYAFMANNSSGSDTQVPSCSNECKESYANIKRLYDTQREQLSDASVEIKAYTQGLKKVEAQLVVHQQNQLWYEQKIKFMKIDLDDKTDVLIYHKKLLAKAQKEKDDLEVIVNKWNHSSKNLGKIMNYSMSASDKFGLGYGDYRYSGNLSYENEVFQSVFRCNASDSENPPLHKRLAKTCEMQAVPPPMTGNYLPSGPDIEIDDSQYTYGPEKTQPSEIDTCNSNISAETSELVSEPVVNESNIEVQPKVWSDAPIIEEYESDSDDECVTVKIEGLDTPSFANKQVKTPRENVKNQSTNSQKPKVNHKELGHGITQRGCFVCGGEETNMELFKG
ncbi:hypothetical protein Tco_0764864, partial [Tanacetum coccineum]